MAMSCQALKEQADAALRQHDCPIAIETYTKCIQLDPENAVLFSNRSYAFFLIGQPQSALEDAKNAIKLKPEWPRAYIRKANALSALGKHDEALCCLHDMMLKCPAPSSPASSSNSSYILQLVDSFRAAVASAIKKNAVFAFTSPNAIAALFDCLRLVAHEPFNLDSNELYCWIALKNVLNSSFDRELDVPLAIVVKSGGIPKPAIFICPLQPSPTHQNLAAFMEKDGVNLIHQRIKDICSYYVGIPTSVDQRNSMFEFLCNLLKSFLELLIHFNHEASLKKRKALKYLPQFSGFLVPVHAIAKQLMNLLSNQHASSPALYMKIAPLFYYTIYVLHSNLRELHEAGSFPEYVSFSLHFWVTDDIALTSMYKGFFLILENKQLKLAVYAIFTLFNCDLEQMRNQQIALSASTVESLKLILSTIESVAENTSTLSHKRLFCSFFLPTIELICDLLKFAITDPELCKMILRVMPVVVAALEGEKSEDDEEGFNCEANAVRTGFVAAGCAGALFFMSKTIDCVLILQNIGRVTGHACMEPDFLQNRLFPLLLKSHKKWGAAGNTPDVAAELHSFWLLTLTFTMKSNMNLIAPKQLEIGNSEWVISKKYMEEHSAIIPTGSIPSFLLSRAKEIMRQKDMENRQHAFDICCRGFFHLLSLKLMSSSEAATVFGKPHLAESIPGGPRITLTEKEAMALAEFLSAPLRGIIPLNELRSRGIAEQFVTVCCYLATRDAIATAPLLKRMADFGFASGLLNLMKLYKPTCPISVAVPASAAIQAIHEGSK